MEKNKIQYLVVAGLIKSENKVLIVYKHTSTSDKCRNKWEIPGGKAAFGLSFNDALQKKIKNYLGVDTKIKRILPKIVSNVSNEVETAEQKGAILGDLVGARVDF